MIQMDFAENFTCLYQDEVASAHWKTNSATIFHCSDIVLERKYFYGNCFR